MRHTHCVTYRQNLSHNSLFCQISLVSSDEQAFPRFARCKLSRLCCHGHSLLLSSYLCRIKQENFSCSAWRHQLQDLAPHPLIFSHLSLSGAPFLALHLPSLIFGPKLGSQPHCWVSAKILAPPLEGITIEKKKPLGRGRVASPLKKIETSSSGWDEEKWTVEGGCKRWIQSR